MNVEKKETAEFDKHYVHLITFDHNATRAA